LGIKIDVSQLEKLATLATTARGSSPVGGDFICNEYKDLFLLKYEGSVSDLKFSPDEVAAVDSKHWTQVKEDLLAQVNYHQYSTLVWCVHGYYIIQIYIHNTHTHTHTYTHTHTHTHTHTARAKWRGERWPDDSATATLYRNTLFCACSTLSS